MSDAGWAYCATIPNWLSSSVSPCGYLVGKLRVGPITLGGICGTLIVSLLIGTRHVSVDDDVKTVFFALFIFSLGYMAGPQFFANLNRSSLRFFALCFIELVCVLGIAYGLAKAFDLDVGTAAGILAGAATESAVVGRPPRRSASSAI